MNKTKKRNGFQKLRIILGKTQAQTATMLGVSLPLVKAIERGRLKVTEKLDRRIRIATGASFGKVSFRFDSEAAEGKPSRFPVKWKPIPGGQFRSCYGGTSWPEGRTYSKAVFEHHTKIFASSPQAAKERFKEVSEHLEKMFIEAAKSGQSGSRNRLPAFEMSLREWMEHSAHQFHLKSPWA